MSVEKSDANSGEAETKGIEVTPSDVFRSVLHKVDDCIKEDGAGEAGQVSHQPEQPDGQEGAPVDGPKFRQKRRGRHIGSGEGLAGRGRRHIRGQVEDIIGTLDFAKPTLFYQGVDPVEEELGQPQGVLLGHSQISGVRWLVVVSCY